MRALLGLLVAAGLSQSGAAAAVPTAADIQTAMNDGIQLEHPQWQEVSSLKIEKGGVMTDGSVLFLCRAKLTWKVDSKELVKQLGEEVKKQAQGAKGLVDALAPLALAMISAQIGEFEKGALIGEYPVRMKLVKAGSDWIAIDSVFGAGPSNALDKLDLSGGNQAK